MRHVPRILCLGRDASLLETRRLVLSTRFQTECSSDANEAAKQWPVSIFDAVLLCHSLSANDRSSAMDYAATRVPSSQVILIQTALGCASREDDIAVRSFDGPEKLLETLTRILQKS